MRNEYRRGTARLRRFTALALLGFLTVGCHTGQPLGPAVPTGATIVGGSIMTSAPPPPSGWQLHPVIPASQQEAQDTVLRYLTQTVNDLPNGVTFDASRYGTAGGNTPCEDKPHSTTELFSALGDLKAPPDIHPDQLVSLAGDAWKRWGWWVFERDGIPKPNLSGLSPDGYELHIGVPGLPGSPHITGTSPCFPTALVRDDIPFPTTITAGAG